jgi:hypothetical protein
MWKMWKSRKEHHWAFRWMNASVIVVIFAWLYLTWARSVGFKETMEAREVAKRSTPISLESDLNFAPMNPFPGSYSSGARGTERYVNLDTSMKEKEEGDSSVLVGCGSCGTAAKWVK